MRTATRKRITDARNMIASGQSVHQVAAHYGVAERTVYRWLDGDHVRSSTLKHRGDCGCEAKPMAPELLQTILAYVRLDKRGVAETLKMLEANGMIEPGEYSAGYVNERIRQLGHSKRGPMAKRHGPRVSVRRQRTAPNIEHQCDATPAGMVYIDNSGDVFYEPHNPLLKTKQHAGKTPVSVFLLCDAYSKAVYLRSYTGERADTWMDFLYRGWSRKHNAREFPFHGLPKILRCDRGSGLMAGVTRRALEEIGVKCLPHEAGQAWKKGLSERLIQSYQQICEPATRHMKFHSLDEFNIFLDRAALYLNNLPRAQLAGLLATAGDGSDAGDAGDAGGDRRATPFAAWLRIDPAKLREPPAWEDWQRLCLWEHQCRIDANMVIRFGSGETREQVELPFKPPFLEYANRGQQITVYYAPRRDDPIVVHLPPMAGFAGGDYRVDRVRPGARPVSVMESNIVTLGERMLEEARRVDRSAIDPMAHWAAAVELHDTPQATSRVVIDAATMFRRMLDRVDFIQRGQRAGQLSNPLSDGDAELVREIFAERAEIEQSEADNLLAEIARVRRDRRAAVSEV